MTSAPVQSAPYHYGAAVLSRRDDGSVIVERAGDIIGIAFEWLPELPVSGDGLIWLGWDATYGFDPTYRYRPVAIEPAVSGMTAHEVAKGNRGVLVCERVR